jgi:hypothetical protein
MAMIYGSIYQLQLTQSSINDRFGLLSLLIIGAANMGMSKTIRTFPKEKSIVSYEIASGMYNTLPYFIGKAISEIPVTTVLNSIFGIAVYYMTGLDPSVTKLLNFISLLILHGIVSESVGLVIGSISPNSDIALAIYPAVVVLNIIFDVSLLPVYYLYFVILIKKSFYIFFSPVFYFFSFYCQSIIIIIIICRVKIFPKKIYHDYYVGYRKLD